MKEEISDKRNETSLASQLLQSSLEHGVQDNPVIQGRMRRWVFTVVDQQTRVLEYGGSIVPEIPQLLTKYFNSEILGASWLGIECGPL